MELLPFATIAKTFQCLISSFLCPFFIGSIQTKLYCVAISCLTSISMHKIPIQFVEYRKKMPKKNLYSFIKTVDIDEGKK